MKKTWLMNYYRDLEIKNAVILYGNIYDYVETNGKYIDIQTKLFNDLLDKRKKVISYDILEGIKFNNMSNEEIYDAIITVDKSRYSYENGEITIRENINRSRRFQEDDGNSERTNNISAMEQIVKDFLTPDKFFNLVYKIVRNDMDISFFVFNGDRLFGKLGAEEVLNDNQKEIFNNLYFSIENINKNRIANHQNIVIALSKLSNLPSDLYLTNKQVSQLQVPLPNIQDKGIFIKDNFSKFKIR